LAPAPHLNRTFVRVIFKSLSVVFLPPPFGSYCWQLISLARNRKKIPAMKRGEKINSLV